MSAFRPPERSPCTFAFGAPNEQSRVQELFKVAGQRNNLVSLVGKIPLEALPAAINEMDFYIASDSGNVYIADAQQVPVILIYGPCCVEEQRPLGDVLNWPEPHRALFVCVRCAIQICPSG